MELRLIIWKNGYIIEKKYFPIKIFLFLFCAISLPVYIISEWVKKQ